MSQASPSNFNSLLRTWEKGHTSTVWVLRTWPDTAYCSGERLCGFLALHCFACILYLLTSVSFLLLACPSSLPMSVLFLLGLSVVVWIITSWFARSPATGKERLCSAEPAKCKLGLKRDTTATVFILLLSNKAWIPHARVCGNTWSPPSFPPILLFSC